MPPGSDRRILAAMSQENVDRFRECIERWNAGDVEGLFRYFHPEIRFEHRLAELGGEVTGIEAYRDWVYESRQLFDSWTTDCDDIRDLGDRVLALGTVTAVGRGGGVETKMPFAVVAEFRNGLVTHFVDYGDREEALKAAGLSESAMSQENVEVARRAAEAWNEDGPESIRRFWAEDGEWHDPPNLPDSRVVRGRNAVAAYLTDQASVVGQMKLTIIDVRARNETVALRVKLTLHGPVSGIDVPAEMAQVIAVADGRIQRVSNFFRWDEALEAARVSE